MNSYELQNKITQYKNCLNKVITTKNYLSSSIQVLSSIMDAHNYCYTIEDSNPCNGYLNDLLDKQKRILSNIDQNILPNINRMISNTHNQYIDTKQKEELEKEVGLSG